MDRIDLDGYLPKSDNTQKSASATEASISSGNDTQSAASDSGAVNDNDPLAVLSALTTFDANVHIKVGEIIHQGLSIKGIDLNTGLLNGTLTLNNASVKNFADASAKAVGKISDLGGNPRFEDMNLTFSAKSVAKLADVLAIELPVPAKNIGKVSADMTVNGTAFLPSIEGTLSGLGANASLAGTLSALPIKPMIKSRCYSEPREHSQIIARTEHRISTGWEDWRI